MPAAKHKPAPLAIRYEIEITPEDIPLRGHFASGDDAADRELEDELLARLNRGDVWAWCCVHVWAIADTGARASAGLGACSYKNEADFRACGYFEDLCKEAAEGLFTVGQSGRQGIQTRYCGPTDSRGSRVKVWAQAGTIYVPWDHARGVPDNHAAAARVFAERWGWTGHWTGGALPDDTGYFFVNVGA